MKAAAVQIIECCFSQKSDSSGSDFASALRTMHAVNILRLNRNNDATLFAAY